MSKYLSSTTRRERFEIVCAIGVGAVAITGIIVGGTMAIDRQEREAQSVEVVTVPDAMVLPACEQEDSRNCYWDADDRGNGEGTSFIDLNGVAYYPESDDDADDVQVGDIFDDQEVTKVHADGSFDTKPTVTASEEAAELAEETGSTLGDMIVCEDGTDVSIDKTADGTPWAACM